MEPWKEAYFQRWVKLIGLGPAEASKALQLCNEKDFQGENAELFRDGFNAGRLSIFDEMRAYVAKLEQE